MHRSVLFGWYKDINISVYTLHNGEHLNKCGSSGNGIHISLKLTIRS